MNALELEEARRRAVPIHCNSLPDRQVAAHLLAHNRTHTLPVLIHAMVIEVNVEVDGLPQTTLVVPKDTRSRHIPTQVVVDERDILVMTRTVRGKRQELTYDEGATERNELIH